MEAMCRRCLTAFALAASILISSAFAISTLSLNLTLPEPAGQESFADESAETQPPGYSNARKIIAEVSKSRQFEVFTSRFITEYSPPTPDSGPLGIAVTRDGKVWFTEDRAGKIAYFDPRSGMFVEYDLNLSGFSLWSLDVDREGLVWFTLSEEPPKMVERGAPKDKIARLSPENGEVLLFTIPTPGAYPTFIRVGPDGSVWFVELLGNKLGRLNPKTGEITEFEVPTRRAGPAGLAFDKEGNVWFSESFSRFSEEKSAKIGVLNPVTAEILEIELPRPINSPVGVAIDASSDVWVVDHGGNSLAKISPREGRFDYFWVAPADDYPIAIPNDVKLDADGALWVAVHGANRIAKFYPSNETFIEFEIPTGPISDTLWLSLRGGEVWFAEWSGNKIGVIKSSGRLPFTVEFKERALSLRGETEGTLTFKVKALEKLQAPLHLSASGTILSLNTVSHEFSQNPVEVKAGEVEKVEFTVTVEEKRSLKGLNALNKVTIAISDGEVTYSVPIELILE